MLIHSNSITFVISSRCFIKFTLASGYSSLSRSKKMLNSWSFVYFFPTRGQSCNNDEAKAAISISNKYLSTRNKPYLSQPARCPLREAWSQVLFSQQYLQHLTMRHMLRVYRPRLLWSLSESHPIALQNAEARLFCLVLCQYIAPTLIRINPKPLTQSKVPRRFYQRKYIGLSTLDLQQSFW